MEAALAGTVLAATLALILTRPWGVNEAWWAVGGGAIVLILGLVSIKQATGIVVETHDALILLVGIMMLSAVAEEAGFFEWAASMTAKFGGGRVFALYGSVFLVGTIITATLSLDTTAIVFTPIVYGMVRGYVLALYPSCSPACTRQIPPLCSCLSPTLRVF